MQSLSGTRAWIEANRDLCVEALRIYLGIALFAKGLNFVFNSALFSDLAHTIQLPFFSFLSVHVIGMVHVWGGLLLAIGLVTRFAALSQVPILFGAVFFVHWGQGLFSQEQALEFEMLVLFLLVFFSVYGSGRVSVDYAIMKRRRMLGSND
jgi:uncharacterized membrane protein YphA (DoxX/SURF4 family)